jgi:hypothetical protein
MMGARLLDDGSSPLSLTSHWSLLDPEAPPLAAAGQDDISSRTWWRACHSLGFLLGGSTFIGGTGALYLPGVAASTVSAALYILGSAGFLSVDALELAALSLSPSPPLLLANVALSCAGSSLYVIGSAGFLPQLSGPAAGGSGFGLAGPALGVWGFFLGSLLIGVSQCFKLARLARGGCAAADARNAAGVEASAGLGALFFLVGTVLFAFGASAPLVLAVWMAGSVAYTVGAACIIWRHAVMGLA